MKLMPILFIAMIAILSACSKTPSQIDDGFLGGIALSVKQSSLTSSSPTLAAGNSATITLSVKDQNGNAFYIPNSSPVVVFSNAGGTSTGTFGAVVDSKNGTFTTTFTGGTTGTATLISATIDGKSVDATASVQVTSGTLSLSNSYVTLSSSTVMSGSSVTATLHTFDTLNNALTAGGLTVAFSRSGGTSTGSFSAITDNGDGTYSANFTGTTAGTATSISASIGGQPITSTLPMVTVNSAGASVILVSSGNSQSAAVGTALGSSLVVVVRDGSSNPVSGVTVDWTVTGNAVLFGASSTTNGSGLASNSLTIGTATGSYTVTATIHGTGYSTSFTETATPGAINNFLLSSVPPTATAGSAFNFTVTARDSYNNVKTDYTGAVHFASTDSNTPTLPSNYTYLAGDLGVKQFSFTLMTSGNQTITVNQVAGGTPTAMTSNIAVSAGTATQLVFITGPTNTQAGAAIGTMLVRALDAQGNTATSYVGTVTLAIGTNASGGALSGTLSGAATAGAISFAGVSINKSGTGYTLTASGTAGVSTATSSTFNITAGSAATIAVSSGNNQSVVAGQALGSSIVAIIQDSLGNAVSGVTVDWATTSGTLGGASSSTNASGLASNTLTTSTTAAAITVTATIHSTATSVTFSESGTPGAATQIVFTTQPTGGVAQGVNLPTQPVLAIKDVNNNTVTTGVDSTADVTLSLTSGTGALGGTLTVTPVAGVATFSGISVDSQGAGKVITATKANTFFSGGTTSKTVASNSFTVNPPAPGAFTISSAVAGASSVVLTWGASSNVATYTVKYGTSTGSYGTTFSSNATSPTTVTGLTPGTTYYFMVTATNVTGSTNATAEAVATPMAAFTISSAAVTTGSTVKLTWAASTGATSYTVKYGTSTGSYGTTFSTSATSPTDVTGLTAGTTYYFMVTAVNSSGSVNASAEASATAIAAFTMTSVTPATLSAVVAWAASTGSTSYDILYDTTSRLGGGAYASSSTGVSSGATVGSLAAGTTYYFRVRANGASGSVLSTNEISSAVYQTFTLNIPFTAGTDSSYTISDSTRVDLTGGVVRLTPASQTDNSTNTGVASGGFMNGTLNGVQWDNTNSYVRLNTTTNNAELDASWTPQWSSLIGYWKLNETSGTTFADSSSYGNTATASGGVTLGAAGKLNSAATFDGTSGYASVPDIAAYGVTTNFSISHWVKAPSNTGMSIRFGPSASCGFSVFPTNTGVDLTTSNGSYNHNSVGTTLLADGAWHFVAVTFSNGTAVFYIDNSTIGTLTGVAVPSAVAAGTCSRYITSQGGSKFTGSLDDIAIWSATLTTSQIQTIYARQSAKYSGQLTSRVLDAYSSQSWTTLALTTTLPFYKELPGSSGSESSSSYSSVGGGLTTGLIGLWHFNESSLNGTASEVVDSSGNANHGASSGTFFNTAGVINSAYNFSGSNSASIPNASNLTTFTDWSFSTWLYPYSMASHTAIIEKMTGGGNWTYMLYAGTNVEVSKRTFRPHFGGSYGSIDYDVTPYNWYHVSCTYKSSTGAAKCFINGKSYPIVWSTAAPAAYYTMPASTGPLNFAQTTRGVTKYSGLMDETAMWSRELSTSEVLELYRRGANRVKYQLRSCSASDCSDQEALTTTYKGWKGPDNTGLSYFSELYNTTSNALAGTVSTGAPTMTFSNFSGTGLSVTANRYFQYRAILESDDQNTLCNYGSGAVACSPELKSIDIGPNHYDTTIQSIISKSTIGSAYQTLDANGMTETLGSNSCSSGAKYSASSDGTTFYYWNGSAWVTSSAYATANDAATMRTNISSFPSSAAGTGTLQIKSYLKSSGTSACEVDNLQFTGKKY